MPSTSNPTGGKEDHSSSLRLNTTPTLSGPRLTRVPLDQQPSLTLLESCFLQKCENCPDERIVPPNHAVATQCSNNSTSAHNSETREARNLGDKVKGVRPKEQVTEELEGVMEGKEITMVPCDHPRPAPLTFVQTEAAGKPITVSAGTSSSSTALGSTPMSPYMSTFTPSLPESTVPFPHSFASASSRPPTSLPLKKQYTQYSALTAPFRSISITRKQSSKIHT